MTEPLPDPFRAALAFGAELERLGIGYVIGGSLASSLAGEPRTTLDVDVALHLPPDRVGALVAALEPGFHVDAAATADAAREGRSFSAIHRETFVKIDAYCRPDRGLWAEELRLRALLEAALEQSRPPDPSA